MLFSYRLQSDFARDILYELATVGELPLPQQSPPFSNKRERDEDTPSLETTPSPSGLGDMFDGPRPIIGSKRVSRVSSQQYEGGGVPQRHLPVYSAELGRLPLHGQSKFVSGQGFRMGGQQTMANQPGYWPMQATGQMPQQQFLEPQLDQGLPAMGLGGTSSLAYNRLQPQQSMMGVPPLSSGMAPASMQSQALPSISVGMDPLLVGAGYAGRREVPGMQTAMDASGGATPIDFDALSMWSNAPTGFECVFFLSLCVFLGR